MPSVPAHALPLSGFCWRNVTSWVLSQVPCCIVPPYRPGWPPVWVVLPPCCTGVTLVSCPTGGENGFCVEEIGSVNTSLFFLLSLLLSPPTTANATTAAATTSTTTTTAAMTRFRFPRRRGGGGGGAVGVGCVGVMSPHPGFAAGLSCGRLRGRWAAEQFAASAPPASVALNADAGASSRTVPERGARDRSAGAYIAC